MLPDGIIELVASCPSCKTLETLWFRGNILVPTLRFKQVGLKVYHDCGTNMPCKLFPSLTLAPLTSYLPRLSPVGGYSESH